MLTRSLSLAAQKRAQISSVLNLSDDLIPTDLAVSWIDDFARISFTDNSSGTAETEIYESLNGGAYTLAHTLAAGVVTYDYYTWQNANINLKVRAKIEGLKSKFSTVENIITPLVFKSNQSVLTQVKFDSIHITSGKSITIDWDDTNTSVISEDTANITKDYSVVKNPYYIKISGDVNDITFFEFTRQIKAYGDLGKWILPTSLIRLHIYSNRFTGDIARWAKNLPSNIEVFHVGSNGDVSTGNSGFTGDLTGLTDVEQPVSLTDFHIEANSFSGVGDSWVWNNPFGTYIGHIILPQNSTGTLTIDASDWIIPDNLTMLNIGGYSANVTNWRNTAKLGYIIATGQGFTGDLTDFIFATIITANEGFWMDFSNSQVTGDLSGKIIPDAKSNTLFNYINFSGANISKLPRGNFRNVDVFNFNSNNCDQTEIDSFLAYLDAYFTGAIVPLTNCTYNLSGNGMAAPSAAGLASIASIQGKYTAAGKVAIINTYVDLSEPTNLIISTLQNGLKLDWTDNTSGACLYEIYESVDGGAFSLINTTLAGVTTYSRTAIINQSLAYKIRAIDGNGNYSDYIQKTATLGSELVDQTAWKASPVAAYWNKYHAANWSADGTKISSSGTNGDLAHDNFWAVATKYKVIFQITRVSGAVYPLLSTGGSVIESGGPITSSKTYHYTSGTGVSLGTYSSSFNGTITGISIKEIIIS